MKVYEINLSTPERECLVPITSRIEEIIKDSGVKDGVCIIFTPHTTAAVTINENADPDVREDIVNFLSEKIPVSYGFKHFEGNSDAHIKSSLIGPSLTLIINEGRLMLGRWQTIYFFEGDGPRNRKIYVKIIKG